MVKVARVGLAYNNVYAVEAGGARVLVDAGPDYAGAWQTLRDAVPAHPDLVIATHGHHDHAGLGATWQEHGVPVYVHEDDRHLVRRPWPGEETAFAGMVAFIEQSGAPDDVRAAAIDGIDRRRAHAAATLTGPHPPAGPGTRWPSGLRYPPFEPGGAEVLEPATQAGMTVLHYPGHTPGNVVVVLESEGWLFSGDQLLPEITPTPAIQGGPSMQPGAWRFRNLPPFLAALRELERRDFSRCFPGHGATFDNVRETVHANIALVEQRAERIRGLLRERGPLSLYGVCEALYPRAATKRFWQIAATVQGHLDVLEDREAVHRDESHRFAAHH